MPGLPRATFEIPLDAGLITRGDKRAKDEPAAERLLNVEFDDIGGTRVRFPFDNVLGAIIGGGTLADCRRSAQLDDERLVFTKDKLYAWVPSEQAWAYRGDHPAVMPDEQTVFSETDDQFCFDRCEFNGQIVYAWQSTNAGTVLVAVADKESGTIVQPPTPVPIAGAFHPRLLALDTGVLLFYGGPNPISHLAGDVFGATITFAPFAITQHLDIPTSSGAAAAYDVCRIPGADRGYLVIGEPAGLGGDGFFIISVDVAFSGHLTPINTTIAVGPIAVDVTPDATFATVAYASTKVKVDILNVTAAGVAVTAHAPDVEIGEVGTGTTFEHLTAAYRLTKDGGHFRCYVFWTLDELDTATFEHRSNWIDDTSALGVAPGGDMHFVYALGLGSRAFAHDSHVYVWGTFAGLSFAPTDPSGTHSELQNTYYLYRDDGLVIAKAVWGEGGGFHPPRWLPNVAVDSSSADVFNVGLAIRRIVPIGPNEGNPITGVEMYAERAPRDVMFTFDDDRARRCVQFGATLYVTGGLVLQYDGAQLTEVGFAAYPWLLNVTNGGVGAIVAAGYSYKVTDRWSNARGELDRSTTATVDNIVIAGAASKITVQPVNLYVTRKTGVAIEVWRTQGNPPPGAAFFLATSLDPSVVAGNNAYLESDPTQIALGAPTLTDDLVDAALELRQASPQNAAVLEPLEPPAASIIMTAEQRLYLAGIPGSPNTIYYSKFRAPRFVAAFHDDLSFDVPSFGGAITALDYLDGALIVWCESATFQYVGPGFDDTGGGNNFQLARTLSTEIGAVSQEGIEFDEEGWYIKTARGWNLLDRGLNYTDVDAGPYRYNDEPVLAIVATTKRHQFRVVTPNRVLMLDTLVKKWAEWTIADAVDMRIDPSGACWYLTATGTRQEITTWDGYAGTDADLSLAQIETTWIKPDGRQQGRYVVDYLQLLGEFRSACAIEVQLAKDYEQTSPGNPNWHTTRVWSPFPTIAGNGLENRTSPKFKRCASIKARYTITNPDGISPLTGPCVRLTSITGQYAVEPGTYGAIASAQKQ